MNVQVVSITQSLIKGHNFSAEDLIVYTARVSNPSNQTNMDTSIKLLQYLINHKHWSPLDMVDMTVEVKTSRAIAQQMLRHRSFCFQEFSQRYAEVVDIELVQIREAGSTTRQGSKEGDYNPVIEKNGLIVSNAISDHIQRGKDLYKSLLLCGVAKEVARMVLPLTTQTTLYMKGSARSWFHYLEQRLDIHAQLEHRQVAQEILKIYEIYFPNLAALLQYK